VTVVATAITFVGLNIGGGMWFMQLRAERSTEAARRDGELRTEIGTAVSQAASLRERFHFQEAQELLKQARQRLERAGSGDLRRLVQRAQADLNLVKGLDQASLRLSTIVDGTYDSARADRRYAAAFAEAGLGREGDVVVATATHVTDSALRAEIVGAVDEWGGITPDLRPRAWLSAVVRKVDHPEAERRPDGRRRILVRMRRALALVRRLPGLRPGLHPHGRGVGQGRGPASRPRGPRLRPGDSTC
jgi:hypothetical protein